MKSSRVAFSFLLTCRPDLLPVDLKRQGRAEEHIALFYPDTTEERVALLHAMQRKAGMAPFPEDIEKFFIEHAGSLSGADIEAVLVRSHMRSSLQNKSAVDAEDLANPIASKQKPKKSHESVTKGEMEQLLA